MLNELKLSQNVFARTVGQTTHVVHIRRRIPIEIENTNRISFVSHMSGWWVCVCVCAWVVVALRIIHYKVDVIWKTVIRLPGHKYHAHGVSHTSLSQSTCSFSLLLHSPSVSLAPSLSLNHSFAVFSFRFWDQKLQTLAVRKCFMVVFFFLLDVSLIFNAPFAWVKFWDSVCCANVCTYAFIQMLPSFFALHSVSKHRIRQRTIFMMHKVNK